VNKPKHTPGPWKNERLDNYGKPYSTLYEAHIDLGPCMIWCPVGNEEQEANAALIADAPKMLELLRELHDIDDDAEDWNTVHREAAELLERHGG
jgi:hypothetical protein